MQICQIAGYKNTGKTTVMEKVIQYFSAKKYCVGSLKHHGHGGDIGMDEHTDSVRHYKAGAVISGVQGEHITQLTLHNAGMEQIIQMYQTLSLDLLVIEGYKQADYPKIVLLKNRDELPLLDELTHIIAVGSWDESILQDVEYPTFSIANLDEFLPLLANYINGRRC